MLFALPAAAQRPAQNAGPPPIPADVLQREQELLRGITPERRYALRSLALRLSPEVAASADPAATVRRGVVRAFPGLSGRELENTAFLVQVEVIRVLRANTAFARVWGDPHVRPVSRGILNPGKPPAVSAAAQAEEARRRAEIARRAAEAARKASNEGERKKWESELKTWQAKLNGIGDDAQLANVDLQNMLQKQQQTLQMMSNITKLMHDTSMSVIRKIGG